MTNRLNTIIQMVRPGVGVIDVGTDHGYVPVTLALNGYSGNIIASDIHTDPLSAAIQYAEANHVQDRIRFSVSDGLRECNPEEVDTVIIAGMGGDLICRIIDNALDVVCRKGTRLILQPMTKCEILRYYLVNNGFSITQECLVVENGKIFQIFAAAYTGVFVRLSVSELPCEHFIRNHSDAELFTGAFDNVKNSSAFLFLLNEVQMRLFKKIYGMECTGILKKNFSDYIFYSGILESFRELRKQYDSM